MIGADGSTVTGSWARSLVIPGVPCVAERTCQIQLADVKPPKPAAAPLAAPLALPAAAIGSPVAAEDPLAESVAAAEAALVAALCSDAGPPAAEPPAAEDPIAEPVAAAEAALAAALFDAGPPAAEDPLAEPVAAAEALAAALFEPVPLLGIVAVEAEILDAADDDEADNSSAITLASQLGVSCTEVAGWRCSYMRDDMMNLQKRVEKVRTRLEKKYLSVEVVRNRLPKVGRHYSALGSDLEVTKQRRKKKLRVFAQYIRSQKEGMPCNFPKPKAYYLKAKAKAKG